jgi:para-aminobenzoate synthetase component I
MLSRNEAIATMNRLGADGIPFLFYTDFQAERIWLKPLSDLDTDEVLFDFNGRSNSTTSYPPSPDILIKPSPVSKDVFLAAFKEVVSEINFGNSFLANLTFETPVKLNVPLEDVFHASSAKYKLYVPDRFVCFSPEIFVQISDGFIRSFPMKGTIDASIPDAQQVILNDAKETAEHITIVDLIRNDLSMVANDVQVVRFRYLDEIISRERTLLQVSSEIRGKLADAWKSRIGDILFSLLPAGSICGAPKPKTIEIILRVENHQRGFYTGVCGLFDGQALDSGVMIRFIEARDGKLYYKSGGGITSFSDVEKEYDEYLNKIYVPVY